MITESMKALGIHCKGRGMNCSMCPDSNGCVDYEVPAEASHGTKYNARITELSIKTKYDELSDKDTRITELSIKIAELCKAQIYTELELVKAQTPPEDIKNYKTHMQFEIADQLNALMYLLKN